MDQNQLSSINKVVMYVWLGAGILGVVGCIMIYFFDYKSYDITTTAMFGLISFMMYGWKRFQISKFSSDSKK